MNNFTEKLTEIHDIFLGSLNSPDFTRNHRKCSSRIQEPLRLDLPWERSSFEVLEENQKQLPVSAICHVELNTTELIAQSSIFAFDFILLLLCFA